MIIEVIIVLFSFAMNPIITPTEKKNGRTSGGYGSRGHYPYCYRIIDYTTIEIKSVNLSCKNIPLHSLIWHRRRNRLSDS